MDPFSKAIRRYVPPDEWVRLSRILSTTSLIGRQEFSTDEASRRVAELTQIEHNCGVVFIGERKWIEYCNHGETIMPYEAWAEIQLFEILSEPSRIVAGLTELTEDIGKLRYYSENLERVMYFR